MTMKKLIFIFIAGFSLAGCIKNRTTECKPTTVTVQAPASEITALSQYLTQNLISATADDRGFFYTVTVPGTGAKPNTCNSIGIDYVAKLTNGTTVDSANNVVFPLNQLITSLQEALPLINVGSSIILYSPPSLAYGIAGQGPVPANANLVFSIKLHSIN